MFPLRAAPDKPINADMEVKVLGLVCPSCALGIKNYLKKEINVRYVAFDTSKQLVLIDFKEKEGFIHYLRNEKIIKIVEKAGYEVKSIKRLDKKKPSRYNSP